MPDDRDLWDLGMGKFTSSEGHAPPFHLWWASRWIAADHYANPNLSDEQKKAFTEKDQRYYETGPLDSEPSDGGPPVSNPGTIAEASNHYDEANSKAPNENHSAHPEVIYDHDQTTIGNPSLYGQVAPHFAGEGQDESMSEVQTHPEVIYNYDQGTIGNFSPYGQIDDYSAEGNPAHLEAVSNYDQAYPGVVSNYDQAYPEAVSNHDQTQYGAVSDYGPAYPGADSGYDQTQSGADYGYNQTATGNPFFYEQIRHRSVEVNRNESMSEDDSTELKEGE